MIYTYGDHWELHLRDDGSLEATNDHEELMMRTTFEGRPVTKASARYPQGSRPVVGLSPNSTVRYTGAPASPSPANPSQPTRGMRRCVGPVIDDLRKASEDFRGECIT